MVNFFKPFLGGRNPLCSIERFLLISLFTIQRNGKEELSNFSENLALIGYLFGKAERHL